MEALGTTATDIITVKDLRKATRLQRHPLVLNREALDIVCAVVGVDLTDTRILVELRDGDASHQGSARRTTKGFKVTTYVAKKDQYLDRHHYVVNNSLCHELRHVAQMQADPDFDFTYALATKTVGYQANPYEVEARFFGRLADHTGTKNTGPAGPAMGDLLWAVKFA